MTHTELLPHAEALVELLGPACVRIEIAGGIRRGKPEPHDIELVAVPRWDSNLLGEPAEPPVSAALDLVLFDLLCEHRLTRMLNEKGNPQADGPVFKKLVITAIGFPVDLFLARSDNWGNIFAIRTGSATFSRLMMTPRAYGGLMPFGHRQRDGYLWRNGRRIPCPEEDDFFRALGVPVLPPAERNEDGIRRLRTMIGAR